MVRRAAGLTLPTIASDQRSRRRCNQALSRRAVLGDTSSMISDYDVVILGGGPAGAATALSLRRHEPSLSIVIVERSDYDEPRIGETLSPLAGRLIEHLGVWEAFQDQNHLEVHGTAASWGAPGIHENPYLFGTNQPGWHLDRARFDRMLASQAELEGVTILRKTQLRAALQAGPCWRLSLSNGMDLASRFVVDATGRSGGFARARGGRLTRVDRLVGFVRFDRGTEQGEPTSLVEAFADGWWYTAGLPDGLRVFACMTEPGIGRRLALTDETAWLQHLQSMNHVSQYVSGLAPFGPIRVRPADSRIIEPVAGESWLAVGDSASVLDPLSAQGIAKALRSGIFASYAIADQLVKQDDSGIHRYRHLVRREFESYLQTRGRYYQAEQRWPASQFWRSMSSPVSLDVKSVNSHPQQTG
jgi:2-polyprenyl-6-methoxyphenol hydroxylase-like FAD-dependent oxidoreductase